MSARAGASLRRPPRGREVLRPLPQGPGSCLGNRRVRTRRVTRLRGTSRCRVRGCQSDALGLGGCTRTRPVQSRAPDNTEQPPLVVVREHDQARSRLRPHSAITKAEPSLRPPTGCSGCRWCPLGARTLFVCACVVRSQASGSRTARRDWDPRSFPQDHRATVAGQASHSQHVFNRSSLRGGVQPGAPPGDRLAFDQG